MIYVLTKPEWREAKTEAITWLNNEEIPRALTYLYNSSPVLGADSETEGFDPNTDRLFCIQLGNLEHQFIFDMRYCPVAWLKPLLENRDLIGVNLKFDVKFWYKIGIRPRQVTDLMLNEINLTNGLYTIKDTKGKFSFAGLCEKYLGMKKAELDKDVGKGFSVKPYSERLSLREITYGADDVRYPLIIHPLQQAYIDTKEVQEVCDLENKVLLALGDMEFNGIGIDIPAWNIIKEEVAISENRTRQALEDYLWRSEHKLKSISFVKETEEKRDIEVHHSFSVVKLKPAKVKHIKRPIFHIYEGQQGEVHHCNINWNSPEQVKPIFDLFKIPCESLDKDVITPLKEKYPLVKLYLEYGKYKSLREKFTDRLLKRVNPRTGNIHTDFWQIVSSGRISASNPNLQQIPSKGDEGKAMRQCFIAPAGEMLVTSDLSGAELRIIAELSQDPLWLDAFRQGIDLHSLLCSEVFKIPMSDVKEPFPMKPDLKYRDVIKTINFGLAYGMTEHKLSNTIGVTKEAALDIIESYFAKVPKVKAYLEQSKKFVRANGVSYTPLPVHRPRYFDMSVLEGTSKGRREAILSSYERAGCNSPIQG